MSDKSPSKCVGVARGRYRNSGIIAKKLFSLLNFLMELLGYCSISAKTNEYRGSTRLAWCLKEQFNKAHVEKVFSYFNTLLDKPEKFKFFDIVISLNKAKGDRLDKDFIRMLLKLCVEIEKVGNEEDTYQVKFECLPSAAERAFRVLQENGNPLHFSEIAKIINHAELNLGKGKRITITNLKNQLIADSRFIESELSQRLNECIPILRMGMRKNEENSVLL